MKLRTNMTIGRGQRLTKFDCADDQKEDRRDLPGKTIIVAHLTDKEQHADGDQHGRAHQRPAGTPGALASRRRGHFETPPTRAVSYDSAASRRLPRSETPART